MEQGIEPSKMTPAALARTTLALFYQLCEEDRPISKPNRKEMETAPFREFFKALFYVSTLTHPEIATSVPKTGKFKHSPWA